MLRSVETVPMKTLGLIGGITWLSTVEYYRAINEQVGARLGGHHSAKIILCTEIPLLLHEGDCPVPTFDTTLLHVGAAVDFALSADVGR